ncbi:peptide chain release factor N(5)-glutamine methyltransferase [Dietzia psychralcaliphila]|uniref:Release factor glutamine methyltransferase n=1 Tax=Dietzia psychralcaliphila TaxID=139021 RepID=A0AAD0JQA2_9ACTN|nr:peptide chain release factor N(5)-glutamine methyltransferase [Dietzia psychralcaliphila]AWH95767.1 protein-(glutamine-N5) methyltransferase, release factor-specific [Dietzia psychralcaliphila]PTM88455.1 release factor glutamine methyltransferase [Dietzia psychralcaliphila]
MDSRPVPASGVVRSAARELQAAGIDSALVEAQLICAHVLGVDRSALPLSEGLDPTGVAEVERIVSARGRDRTPLQYLLGRAVSGRLDLAVGPGVFIPRPETELLVENTLGALPAPGGAPGPVVVDLCAGSGTLALEIAHARPDARVHAVELHEQALGWLRRNATERAAAGDTPVEVHEGDATAPDLLVDMRGGVDAVVSNPPYIPQSHELPEDVLGHEPPTALFGGDDGLAVIRPLVDVAAGLLAPGGHLAVEHDDTTGAAVAAVVSAQGCFGNVEQHTDLAGRPRFVTATRLDDHPDDDEVDSTARKGISR